MSGGFVVGYAITGSRHLYAQAGVFNRSHVAGGRCEITRSNHGSFPLSQSNYPVHSNALPVHRGAGTQASASNDVAAVTGLVLAGPPVNLTDSAVWSVGGCGLETTVTYTFVAVLKHPQLRDGTHLIHIS